MNTPADTRPAKVASSATHASAPFWLTDPETRARIEAAVDDLIAVTYWAVQDDVTFLEALESLAMTTCDDLKLDRSLVPLIQMRTAAFAAQWATEHEEPVDPLSSEFPQLIAAFEKYPTTVQAALLDTYEARWEYSEGLDLVNNG